jgi:hypothetical protein
MAIRYKKHALFVVSEGLFKDTLVECQGYTDEEGAIFKVIASNIPIHNFNLMDIFLVFLTLNIVSHLSLRLSVKYLKRIYRFMWALNSIPLPIPSY